MRARRAGPLVAVLGSLVLASGSSSHPITAGRAAGPTEAPTVWSRWVAVDTISPTPLRTIVVLGDSVPAGTGCACTAFGTLLARAVPGPTRLKEDAGDGVTAAQLAADLRRPAAPLRDALRTADVITITAGANDFLDASTDGCTASSCDLAQLKGLRGSLDSILVRVRALAPTARLLVTGYWSVFLDGRLARTRGPDYVRSVGRLTRAVNSVIAGVARSDGATFVDLFAAFKGTGVRDDTGLLAPDGDHPSARGHQVIAAALLRALSS